MTVQNKLPLDADVAALQRRWQESGVPDLYAGGDGPVSRERARNVRAFLYPKPALPTGRLERSSIEGPNGPIAIEIVQPVAGAPIGTLVFFHGGGFIIGDLDSHQAHAIRLANRSRVVVVNVEYRLAPEYPFPQGVEDAIAGVRWTHANLARLGTAGLPLAVGGDSAGGNFAAVAAICCRDTGLALAAQLLLYAVTDMRREGNAVIRNAYLGARAARKALDFRASPVVADLGGVAPAIIGIGAHDFLYEQNLAYAERLRCAGVAVICREFLTLNHGFFSYTAVSAASADAADLLCDDLGRLMTEGAGA